MISAECNAEVLDSVRVDEVVDGAVCMQQKTNGCTAIRKYTQRGPEKLKEQIQIFVATQC